MKEQMFYNNTIATSVISCNKGGGYMENEDYKQKIIGLIDNCSNNNFLKFVYELILSFKKKWGV